MDPDLGLGALFVTIFYARPGKQSGSAKVLFLLCFQDPQDYQASDFHRDKLSLRSSLSAIRLS